jgi:hypothetical protein
MNATEALNKIKALFAEEGNVVTADVPAPAEETKMSFETYDLKDGSKIELTALEIGADAMLADESGNTAPCPDGEYELADGTNVTVTAGKVSGIETAQAEEPASEEPADSMPAPAAMEEQFSAIDSEIEVLKATNESLKAELSKMEGKFNQAFAELIAVVEGLSKLPSVEPTQAPRAAFSAGESRASKEARLLERLKAIK